MIVACGIASGAALLGCGSSLPKPASGPVPQDALLEVPYPPPPARVEIIPPRPNTTSVWIDGQWEWVGEKWRWLPGGWVNAPANAYFTPWTTVRRSDGRLFYAKAAWRHVGDAKPLDMPEVLAPAKANGRSEVASK